MPFGSQVAARDPFIGFPDQQNAPEATIRPAAAFDSDGQQPVAFAAAEQEQRDQSWTTAKPVWTPQGTLQQTAEATREAHETDAGLAVERTAWAVQK